MPILHVELVEEVVNNASEGLSQRLADAAAEVFDTPPGETWVLLRPTPPAHYAENGGSAAHPVFVSVLLARFPTTEQLGAYAADLALRIGEVCGRPAENVHVVFEPEAAGRIAFGGRLLGKD